MNKIRMAKNCVGEKLTKKGKQNKKTIPNWKKINDWKNWTFC